CLFPGLAIASPVTYDFTGTIGNGGFTGSLTYDQVIDVNVRGMAPNVSYGIAGYAFTVAPAYAGLPESIAFNPGTGSAELCMGACVFGAGDATSLAILGNGYRLTLTFAGTWGAFDSTNSKLQ